MSAPNIDRERSTEDAPFEVVAIGSSAGGVEALHLVLSVIPADFPAAILIVQHMDPRHKSLLAMLLGRHCKLPVRQAEEGEPIVGGTVYIAQPDMHMIVRDRHIAMTDTKHVHFSRPSIDVLFESVANVYGDRAIGVILSGSGSDGANGIREIKAKGGTTVVQDPSRAVQPSMPQAARGTGCVDFTLPLEDMGMGIVKLVMPNAEVSE